MDYAQHLIIPDRSGTHVLLQMDGSGWRLPRVTDSDWMLVGKAQSWVRDRLGLAIVVLWCVLVEEHEKGEELSDAYLFTETSLIKRLIKRGSTTLPAQDRPVHRPS
jgi:hypothetical protein